MSEHQKKILVVDDEVDTLELVQAILSYENFQVLKALNGNEALELLTENPDLILLDVKMPGGLSGLDICHLLKGDEKYQHIPILFFSAKVLDQDIEEGLKAGAVEYITKPFKTKDLIQLIYKHIK